MICESMKRARLAAKNNAEYFGIPYCVFFDTSGNARCEAYRSQNPAGFDPSMDIYYPPDNVLLLVALKALAKRCKGCLGQNPYIVSEYKQALMAIKQATGFKGDWMDVELD